jgi:hypothetical protein
MKLKKIQSDHSDHVKMTKDQKIRWSDTTGLKIEMRILTVI